MADSETYSIIFINDTTHDGVWKSTDTFSLPIYREMYTIQLGGTSSCVSMYIKCVGVIC